MDLDGTLIGPNNSISAENIAAIRRAVHRNAAVVIATGRAYVSADAVARLIGLPPVPVVAFNGALIRWTGGGDILHSCCIPADLAAEVVDECQGAAVAPALLPGRRDVRQPEQSLDAGLLRAGPGWTAAWFPICSSLQEGSQSSCW